MNEICSKPMDGIETQQDWSKVLNRIAAERDRQQFSALYDHFAPLLKSYLIGRGAGAAIAEEILQETLLQVWHRAHQFNAERGNAATWIYRVARNKYYDHLRHQRLADRPPPEPDAMALDGATQTERELESELDGQLLSNTLQQLPSRQAQVLYMSYYQGKSHAEIAQSMEIPLGSVKSTLRLAFEKLRSCLGGAR
ncbi:sigma-70 family RNA polymerase sigma factor [Motiliproteus sp.]|uniref:sigma-70 family RNA polymerase sigma factor n=1 Tax=Motiliproteus sp. TaxID=1898955 RepID=UPI003BAAA488